jgi:phospholipase C
MGLFKVDYPQDYHPPHDVARGESFLAEVYQAIRNSPYRDAILLIVTFDEHGGCYDHVPPAAGAAPPYPGPISRDGTFDFSRFGVRVPAIVISSYIRPGTVFRASDGEAPYDHCSILSTLRDWLRLDGNPAHPFLPSPRIKAAPTLNRVLTLSEADKRIDWPDITASVSAGTDDTSFDTPLNDVQKSLLASALAMNEAKAAAPSHVVTAAAPATAVAGAAMHAKALVTYKDAFNFLHPQIPAPE